LKELLGAQKTSKEEQPSADQTPKKSPVEELSTVHEGDEISRNLAQLIQRNARLKDFLPKNTCRLSEGVYQFGSKEIQLALVKQDVVVKVGGGFVSFDLYARKYGVKRYNSSITHM